MFFLEMVKNGMDIVEMELVMSNNLKKFLEWREKV